MVGDLNNICTSGAPAPELATSGIDSMITTPGSPTTGKTLYDNYGMAGQYWASTGLTCSQMTSSIGNNVAGMVFDMAKSLDRVTITVYQSAAGANILSWLSSSVDNADQVARQRDLLPVPRPRGGHRRDLAGLAGPGPQARHADVRGHDLDGHRLCRRDLADRPAQRLHQRRHERLQRRHLGAQHGVREPARHQRAATACPSQPGDPQSVTANYSFTSGNGLVDQNANELWTVLVCKPWLDGELGTTQYATPGTAAAKTNVVNLYGRQLLWAQAVAANEQPVTTALVNAKQATYSGIAQQLQQTNPSVYSLFQGDQWTTRLEIGFEALFAAVAAGLLVLLIALTLIMLKLGFLLLLVAGPFFLIIGIHPGFGRVIAIRWFEMLVGVLLKQIAVALTLSVLLYCYSLIMGTTDQALPWALKIMMIALVTVTVFIYRKPFQHLFSSVGYGMLGAEERAQVSWRESTFGFRRVTAGAAGAVVPGMGARSRVALGAARRHGRRRRRPTARRRTPAVSRRQAPPSPRGCPACPPRTATSPGGSGRTRGSAPAPAGTAAAAVAARRTAGERPLGGLGPQRRRGDGHRGARAGAAAGTHERCAASGTPERGTAGGSPERTAAAGAPPGEREQLAERSQPHSFANHRMERPGERESRPRRRSGHDRGAGRSNGASSWI